MQHWIHDYSLDIHCLLVSMDFVINASFDLFSLYYEQNEWYIPSISSLKVHKVHKKSIKSKDSSHNTHNSSMQCWTHDCSLDINCLLVLIVVLEFWNDNLTTALLKFPTRKDDDCRYNQYSISIQHWIHDYSLSNYCLLVSDGKFS